MLEETMSRKMAIIGLLCLVYCTGSVYAAPTDACTGGPGAAGTCGAGELCNAATGGVCECDAANGYEESGDPAACTLKDCSSDSDPTGYTISGNTQFGQTPTGSCDTGNGYSGTAAITSSACTTGGTWDAGEFSGCALVDCSSDSDPTGYTISGNTQFGQTPTGSCDTGNGYDGTASITSSACTTGGTWDSGEFSGCTLVDCAGSGDPTGYTSLASTLFGETPTGSCDTGNGYDGTASITSSACTTGGTWDSGEFSGCTLVDCASDSTPSGYTNLANTKYGESAAANCDTGSGYSGTAALAVGACKTDGTWDVSKFSGCTSGGGGGGSVDLGNSCTNDGECTSGNGGSGSKCGTSTNCECDDSRNYVASASTCKLATDLGNTCSANEECTLGNGGAGATCSTNCVCDEASGYTQTGTSCTQNAGSALLSMFNVVSMLAFILIVKLM